MASRAWIIPHYGSFLDTISDLMLSGEDRIARSVLTHYRRGEPVPDGSLEESVLLEMVADAADSHSLVRFEVEDGPYRLTDVSPSRFGPVDTLSPDVAGMLWLDDARKVIQISETWEHALKRTGFPEDQHCVIMLASRASSG